MNSFSISQIAQYAGIKPHTIRIWEQRYNALKPTRSEGNTRYYNNSQLRRLLNIVSLRDTDYKVSELCAMPDKKLFELVEQQGDLSIATKPNKYLVSQLIAAGMNYDETNFEKIFSHCLLKYGLRNTYTEVLYPMLIQLGLMWTSNSLPPVHEHFISNLIRQKLLTAVDSLPPAKSESDSWLLFLPENEFHEIGLLFANYLIRLSGKKVVYLGANVPLQSLKVAVKDTKPSHLLLFFVHNNLPENAQEYLNQLTVTIPKINLFLSGSRKLISQLETGKRIQWLKSIEDLEQQLKL